MKKRTPARKAFNKRFKMKKKLIDALNQMDTFKVRVLDVDRKNQ